MHEIAFSIGQLQIHWYGIMAAAGFFLVLGVFMLMRKKTGLSVDSIFDMVTIAMISGIAGARLFYIIQFPGQFREHPLDIIRIDKGGLVFYGGFLVALAALWVYSRIKKIKFLLILDAFAPAMALGHAAGRIGCFMQGCCFGKPCSYFFGVVFPEGSGPAEKYPAAVDIYSTVATVSRSMPLYPVQLFEAAGNVVICIALAMMFDRFKKNTGRLAALYMIMYGTLRFLVETLRGDHTDFVFGIFTPAQTIGLLLVPAGMALFIFCGGDRNKKENVTENE